MMTMMTMTMGLKVDLRYKYYWSYNLFGRILMPENMGFMSLSVTDIWRLLGNIILCNLISVAVWVKRWFNFPDRLY